MARIFPSIEKTLGKLANLMSPAMRRHVEESRTRFDKQAVKIERQRTALVECQRQERRALDKAHKRRVTDETKTLAAAMPRGFKALWRRMRDHDPDARADAVELDRTIRTGFRGLRGEVYLHRSAVPPDEADLSTDADRGQLDL